MLFAGFFSDSLYLNEIFYVTSPYKNPKSYKFKNIKII
jgi:hypothetical protein